MKKYKRFNQLAGVAIIAGSQLYAGYAHASLSDEEERALIQKVNELEQQVKDLQQGRKTDQVAAEKKETADIEKKKTTPTISLGANGLSVRSGDSNFVMTVHGYAQVDDRTYFGQKAAPGDNLLLRRVRPIVEGTVWDRFNYRIMLDLASGNVAGSTANNNNILDDAYVNAKVFDQFQIQAGKYKSPIGLERLQSTAELYFVETGFATALTPNYDLGIEAHNDYFNTPIGYAVGIFNGATDGGSVDSDVDEGKDVVGRLFFSPFIKEDTGIFKYLGFGAAGSIGQHTSGSLASYKTSGQQTIFSYGANATPGGELYRIDPQAYYYWGPFGIMGEYVLSSQKIKSAVGAPYDRFNNSAWQVEGTYFLTGEDNSFKAGSLKHVVPLHPFSFSGGGWGAFEVVGRVQQLTLDDKSLALASATSAHEATAWSVGINWYLNSNIKLNLNYESTSLTGGNLANNATAVKDEHVLLSRVQFQF